MKITTAICLAAILTAISPAVVVAAPALPAKPDQSKPQILTDKKTMPFISS